MNVLDLFSGIGGFSLGLERAGMRTVAFCEIDPFCRKILAKNFPGVPIFGDVRTLTAEALADTAGQSSRAANIRGSQKRGCADGTLQFTGDSGVDVICGGFPCQDISVAGKGAGIEGERSGLWSEYARIIGELRPRYVIVENVAALLGRGLGRVLGDLAALGYDAEWHCIPASAVGAPHRRDRLWIVAYPECAGLEGTTGGGLPRARRPSIELTIRGCDEDLANANGAGLEIRQGIAVNDGEKFAAAIGAGSWAAEPDVGGMVDGISPTMDGGLNASSLGTKEGRPPRGILGEYLLRELRQLGQLWSIEPDIGRIAHGIPNRVGRLRGLGNAVVPQIPEIIGRAIMAASQEGQQWCRNLILF